MSGLGEFTWTSAGAWASFLALCGIIARQVGPWRRISVDAEKEFRDGLIARVSKLERDLEIQRARHDAEIALARHRLNNVTQCFDAVMMMLKSAPDKVTEIIVHIEQMRAEQLKAEALEKAAIHEAVMGAVGGKSV